MPLSSFKFTNYVICELIPKKRKNDRFKGTKRFVYAVGTLAYAGIELVVHTLSRVPVKANWLKDASGN
jgi:hypothetical protein